MKTETSQQYETRVTRVTVSTIVQSPETETHVEIADEGGGEFVVVSQVADEPQKISFAPEEWPAIRAAINRMIKNCR